MATETVRKWTVGLLLIAAITAIPGGLAAQTPEDELDIAAPELLATPESEPVEPADGGCLELLEAGSNEMIFAEEHVVGEGEYVVGEGEAVEFVDGFSYATSGQFWFRGDYLLLWTNGNRLPPLVTTSPVGEPVGVLGAANTSVLFGGGRVNRGGRSNFRASLGYWVDACQSFGFEGDYFDSTRHTVRFSQLSPGEPVLARPFYDVVNDIQSSQIIAYPGLAVGSVTASASEYYESTGARMRRNLMLRQTGCVAGASACGESVCSDYATGRYFRLDLLAGYRYHRLVDHVAIREDVVITDLAQPPAVRGTMFNIEDDFRARNEFNGGELGLLAQFRRDRWSLELQAKMALGNNHQVVFINGTTAITTPVSPPEDTTTTDYAGGVLALANNSGRFARDEFIVIPQVGVELGYQVTCGLRAYLGYNLLYWANVARAGHHIDLNIDPANLPPVVDPSPGPEPTFGFHSVDFWAQGFTAGFEVSF